MTYNIRCMSWAGDESDPEKDPDFREWEINTDGKLWPCCKFVVIMESQSGPEKLEDETLKDLIDTDPNWNSLMHHDIDEIINHWAYSEYIHPKGWNSDTPPSPCVRFCAKQKKLFDPLSQEDYITRFNQKK